MSGVSAFLRFSRDRRGYEHFYLIKPTINRRGKRRARVLYWFRTPPGVAVGRAPFDEEMRRAIEEENPGVSFDWKRILATPIPPPVPIDERRRERRRAERAERAASEAEVAEDTQVDAEEPDLGEHGARDADSLSASEETRPGPGARGSEERRFTGVDAPPADAAPSGGPPGQQRRRRRRRRRGGRGGGESTGVSVPAPPDTAAGPASWEGPQHLDEPQGE